MDEATDLAKSLANHNGNCLVFALMPIIHQATDRQTVVQNRRNIEDKLMSTLA